MKTGPIGQKTAKMVIYIRHSVKKRFSKSKSHSLIEAHDLKYSFRSEKISSHGNFAFSLLGQNAV